MVRVWCVPVFILRTKRFGGLHNEVGTIISQGQKLLRGEKGGWTNHPEVKKWAKRLGELVTLHDKVIVPEFERRGWNHNSPLKGVEYIKPKPFACTEVECVRDILEVYLRQGIDVAKPKGSPPASVASKMMRIGGLI